MTTWTAPPAHRVDEPFTGAERAMLEGWLDWHRQTLLSKCAGLTAEQLKRRAVEPSSLSLLGLLRHMTDVERSWFRIRAAGEQLPYRYSSDTNLDGEFDDVDQADAEADHAAFLSEIAAVRAAMADISLEHEFATERRPVISVRWA